MPSYAIVSEGVTDQIAIERMIELICHDAEELDINFLQPSRDATDAHHAPHGGWQLVFEYCAAKAGDALATNDFLIVQLDTDCGEEEGFGLPLADGGAARDQTALHEDASVILANLIGSPLFDDNADRIIFAISIHSLENWLLLILYGDNAVVNGFDRLNRRLRRANEDSLVKTAERYHVLVKAIKRRRLMELVGEPHSLGTFLARLQPTCQIGDRDLEAGS